MSGGTQRPLKIVQGAQDPDGVPEVLLPGNLLLLFLGLTCLGSKIKFVSSLHSLVLTFSPEVRKFIRVTSGQLCKTALL